MRPDTKPLNDSGPIAAFDTEDDSNGNVTQIVLVTDDGTAHHLDPNPGTFYAALRSLDANCTIYSHNIEYDVGNALRGYLRHCTPLLGGGGKLIGVNIKNGPKLRCTFSHFRRSLKFVGSLVGREKTEMDVDDPMYCENDTRICLDAARYLRRFYASINAGCKATSSSSSLSQFMRNHLDRDQPVPLANHRNRAGQAVTIREAYYGGRTECFEVGHLGDVYMADINSAYGWAMATQLYPDTSTARMVRRFDIESEGVCNAKVRIPSSLQRCPLPFRSKAGNLYPNGSIRGWWTAPELRYAARNGCTVQTGAGIDFSESWRPFGDFVERHYRVKATTKSEAEKFFRKLLVNSLYGMFGLSPDRQVYINDTPKEGQYIPWGTGAIVPRFNVAPFANQIWAVYTTAYVRIRLAEFMDLTEQMGGTVVYCDTDSIFYRADREIWGDTDDLGDLSAEGFAPMRIVAPKCYQWGDALRIKGIKNARPEHLDGLSQSWETPTRLLVAMKKAEAVNVWRKTSRGIMGEYTRRIVHSDGTTSPLYINSCAKSRF